jgi:hypothetical protein
MPLLGECATTAHTAHNTYNSCPTIGRNSHSAVTQRLHRDTERSQPAFPVTARTGRFRHAQRYTTKKNRTLRQRGQALTRRYKQRGSAVMSHQNCWRYCSWGRAPRREGPDDPSGPVSAYVNVAAIGFKRRTEIASHLCGLLRRLSRCGARVLRNVAFGVPESGE